MRLVLMLALCTLWATTPLIAEFCAIPATHCDRHMQMPCCPPAAGSPNCSTNLCPAQVGERAVVTRAARAKAPARAVAATVQPQAASPAAHARELTSGLHYSPPVFRLKDDLRI